MLCWIMPKNIKKELSKSNFIKSNFVERFTVDRLSPPKDLWIKISCFAFDR